ncbi:MAG TPA: cytochrome d ubiquinol oxidase subunit II [Solirubrobacteraceae bacterium]|nr:cytochrome d ubiquinol oxidase subunit II [Solirubrobacteraceae bacterium]
MTSTDVAATVLWTAATLYAVLGGADFGVGFWDLVAGGAKRGARPRALIDRALAPVWEANHVWLIFALVVLWTAFPRAFAAVTTTLFVPLALAALGIVLRGSGFAFRKVVGDVGSQRLAGATFALSSVLTPFFMGTAIGAIATGRVPATGSGDRLTSWLNLTSLEIGALFVAACAYLAAVFLVADARRVGDTQLERYFRVRALAAAAVTGALAAGGLFALHEHARSLFDGLIHEGLPLVIASAVCGSAALILLGRAGWRAPRALAAAAVASVIWGWGIAQYPYLLPRSLTVHAGAGAHGSVVALLIVCGVALIVVVPALLLLFSLHQRSLLEEAHAGDPVGDRTSSAPS